MAGSKKISATNAVIKVIAVSVPKKKVDVNWLVASTPNPLTSKMEVSNIACPAP